MIHSLKLIIIFHLHFGQGFVSTRHVHWGTQEQMDSSPRTKTNMSIEGSAELTSALSKLDRQWEMNSRSSKGPTGGKAGWTKLILDPPDDANNTGNEAGNEGRVQNKEEFVYLLEPTSTPSLVVLFLGGAGLGQFPHIAYSELLSRISKRLNAAIITAPYPLGLDHFDLSKKSGEALRRAVVQCEDKGGYSTNLPKFYLGHSLGSKLLSISLCASGVRDAEGIGFMSYNNFGFKDTISMVKEFADDLNSVSTPSNDFGTRGANFDQILDFAGEAAGMLGFEFSPDPSTMDRIIEIKFDAELQKKTRLFIFDEDNLDSSDGFIDACSGTGPSISRLKGKHLSPVYLKFGINDFDISDDMKPFINEASGGFQSASFGDEESMNGAVDETCDWIMGKQPNNQYYLTENIAGESGEN